MWDPPVPVFEPQLRYLDCRRYSVKIVPCIDSYKTSFSSTIQPASLHYALAGAVDTLQIQTIVLMAEQDAVNLQIS